MKIFYELIPAFPFDVHGNPWFITFDDSYYEDVQSWPMRNDRRITDQDCPLRARCPSGTMHACDFMLAPNGYAIFSNSMARLIDSLSPRAMKWFPIQIFRTRSRKEINGYSIGATNYAIDAIDRDRTRVSQDDWTPRDNGTLRVLYPIWIRGDLIPDCCIFRLSGSPSELWVTEQFKQAVEESELTGCRFRKAHIS